MNIIKYIPPIAFLLLLIFSEINVCAGNIGGPIVAGLGLIVIVGIMVAVVFFLAYFMVWLVKRKK